MLEHRSTVQPTANRLRLAPGFETRRGSLQPKNASSTPIGLILLALNLFCSPLEGASVLKPDGMPDALYSFACFTMVLDSKPLWAGAEGLPSPHIERKPVEAPPLLPAVRVPVGKTPRTGKIDWTGHWMFALGLLLFWVSWLLAAWERRPRLYAAPLCPGEPAPAPRPPGIVFTLERPAAKDALSSPGVRE